MKMIKKALALILTMMLVLSSIVVADSPMDFDDDSMALDGGELDIALDEVDLTSGDDDILLDELGDITLDGVDLEPTSNAANYEPLPFEQKVELEGVTISVTAVPDVFPEGAALRVSDVIEDGIAQAARAAAEAVMSGEVKYHLISIEVVDRNWNLCAPNGEMEFPLMTVEGLVFDGAIRVMVYDQKAGQGREIETIEINRVEKTLRFNFVDSAVYDVVEERKDEGTGNNEDEGKGEEDEGTGNSEQE